MFYNRKLIEAPRQNELSTWTQSNARPPKVSLPFENVCNKLKVWPMEDASV